MFSLLIVKCLELFFIKISGYLNLGYSTPFLSLGASHMYPSLAAAKAAVIAVGEEIATQGLPLGVSPIVFVFVGTGNGIIFLPVLILIFVHPFDQASNSNAADYIS